MTPPRAVAAVGARSSALAGELAIISVTALGMSDAPPAPIIGKMDGAVIQAQVLESAFSGSHLVRPAMAPWMEHGALLLAGACSSPSCLHGAREGTGPVSIGFREPTARKWAP